MVKPDGEDILHSLSIFSGHGTFNEIPVPFKTALVWGVRDSHNIHYHVSWPGGGTSPFEML